MIATTLPIKLSDVCLELYGSTSTVGKSLSQAFTDATGTFDATYESINGYRNSLQNFRGYNHIPNTEEHLSINITISEVGNSYNWVDQDNIKTLTTTTFAYSDMNTTVGTDYLIAETFQFNIPVLATINGIEMKVMRRATANGTIKDGFTNLRSIGSIKGDNKAVIGAYTTTWSEITYGGPTDLWGTTWTVGEINASNFGCSFRPVQPAPATLQRVQVAYIQLKVYYTL